jgi:integrase
LARETDEARDDAERSALELDLRPPKREELALAKSGSERHGPERLEVIVVASGREDAPRLLRTQRFHLLPGRPYDRAGFVFRRTDERPLSVTTTWKRWRRLLVRAKVPAMPFHSARHSAATLLLGQGVHPKIVSEMLGHSTVAITLDVYSHVTPGDEPRGRACDG